MLLQAFLGCQKYQGQRIADEPPKTETEGRKVADHLHKSEHKESLRKTNSTSPDMKQISKPSFPAL